MTPQNKKTSILAIAVFMTALALSMGAPAAEKPSGITADQAQAALKEGNARFVAGKAENPNSTIRRVEETSRNGQHPIATVLGCSDSRVPVELIFDQGIGDVFVVRVAGNVADTDEVGSIEYATEHLSTPLVVVLGHTACGAVSAVATEAEVEGSLQALLDHIRPAVDKARAEHPDASSKDIVPAAIRANVWQSIEDILTTSDVIADMVRNGKVKVVGALYDISTGKVEWMGEHPEQGGLIGAAEMKSSAPAAERPPAGAVTQKQPVTR
jgi:carbonic anhydrase